MNIHETCLRLVHLIFPDPEAAFRICREVPEKGILEPERDVRIKVICTVT